MHRNDALDAIGQFLGLDPAALAAFADEDAVGGYPEAWPSGSLWAVEGQTLYALVRALRPEWILELGVHYGASTSHLREALRASNGGYVTSVDKWEGAGARIPQELAPFGTLIFAEAVAMIQTLPDSSIDFCFEDCIHSTEEVYAIVTALKPKLRPGAVVVHHDSEHGDDGVKVRQGLNLAGVDYLSCRSDPSDCGLAVWRMS